MGRVLNIRQMPVRFLAGAPLPVHAIIADIFRFDREYMPVEIILRDTDSGRAVTGLEVSLAAKMRGEHFELSIEEFRKYRIKNARNRVKWESLPEETRAVITAYAESIVTGKAP